MTPTRTVRDCLSRAFVPTQRGVTGLTEQLLGAFIGGDAEFERVGNECVCRWTVGGDTQEVTAPLPPAAFRTILARIAVLCNERTPGSVNPYHGEGLLSIAGDLSTIVHVSFINTPEKQHLTLKSSGVNIPKTVERNSVAAM